MTDALLMAVWRRGKPDALLHHSDQGSQGGFKRSSQHQLLLFSLMTVIRQALLPAFSSPVSFSVGR
ncbi:hypothetical protein ACVMFA_009571 [Bradyrhizobium liaoningense]